MRSFTSHTIKNEIEAIENLLISKRYKILFAISKIEAETETTNPKSDINIYCLRNNCYQDKFTTITGVINESKLLDKRDIMILLVYCVKTKKTDLQIWNYNERSNPLSTFNMSILFNYNCTINTID